MLAVTPGAAGLLIVAFDALGQIEMRDKTHIRLVDTHAKGNGCDDDHALFATQLADKGVRVNAILPGLVESRDFGWTPEHRAERLKEYLYGFGTPRDIGEAVRFLASPVSRWITGTQLNMNDGTDRSYPQ